jgi:hypothetical protein
MRKPRPVAVALIAALAALAVAATRPAIAEPTSTPFSSSYSGTGSGHLSGTTVSGSATLAGHGTPIGTGTLTGSATGSFISSTCVTFDAHGTLSGPSGALKLSVTGAQACATGATAEEVAFSGHAKIVGGSATFASARGTLRFSGSYNRVTNRVTVSFRGPIDQ